MARTALAPTSVGAAGVDPGGAAVAAQLTDGNSFPWGERRHLYVVNGDTTALTVTVQTPSTVGAQALAVADATYTIPAGGDLLLPRLGWEFRRTDGRVWVDYAGADASVTVAVLDL
ncbi:hypothetical protein ACFWR9_42665 [Streptomyces sp. NPDC058534]|uniref:hypothetical protein n=1 Tax=Streptomyces sp. NPDC058534 TaxID=3346541 RepID=UPI003652015F